jgi:predicted MPP superfamily phosphohydrolase
MLVPCAWLVGALAHVPGSQSSAFAFGLSALAGLWSARSGPRRVELDVEVAGLPAEFDGYRIAQISDIHCGSFTPKRTIDRWVATMNAQRPDLIAVTGDLITSGDAYTEDVAAALSALDAPDGVYACMGNHDYFCDAERLVAALREGGLRVLRNEGEHITRDGARLYIAGIEDAWTQRHDLPRTLAARDGAPTILLAHDPNHFPAAAKAGVALQLSGHTHGGQAGLPIARGRYNLARLITRYTHGLFQEGGSQLYVSRGAGTTGPPLRLFAPAELTFLTLRASNEVDSRTDRN